MSYPALSVSRRFSRHLLAGVATLAIAASVLPRPAAAQSFQGTPTVTVGGATVNTSPNNTQVNINAPVTVINWRPDDTTGTGNIQFQSAGTTALFRSINFQDFTVLNRILPVDANGAAVITRPVRFDGTVNSQFGVSAVGPAGSIWFYTPGGIILGSSSAFNVGSLVLSTSDINQANVFVGNTGTINFTGTPNTSSAISIENGAQISALINGSSYVALVAPRIVQNGTIRVDGSAALVGAEAVDITMGGPGGLFDITVSTGTSDANGVVHGELGTTTGPASGGAGDPHRIYMMAIPKNTAISMLVNGNIGYTPAASATVQNGEVILSAGYNIAGGTPNFGEHAAPVNNVQANLNIGDSSTLFTTFSSRTFARASGNLLASPGSNGADPNALTFTGSAILAGDLSAIVETSNGDESLTVGGDLFVLSRRAGQGGNAAIRAFGGLFSVGGNLLVDASSLGFSGQASGISLSNSNGGNGRGGNASINVLDGNVRITGTTSVNASGAGGYGIATMGSGFGGNASVSLTGTNTIALFTGGLDVQGSGFGVIGYLASLGVNIDPPETVNGGNGTGGSATVAIGDVNLLTLPNLTISARGIGDAGGSALANGGIDGGNGGIGTGGTASLSLNDQDLVLPDLVVNASGIGGNGGRSDNIADAAGNGGAGIGGTATIALTGAASFNSIDGAMVAIATGTGGSGGDIVDGGTLDSGSGGSGTGGTASISIGGSSQVGVGTILAFADGRSGRVGTGGSNFGGTGLANGGNASVNIATTGTVDANAVTVSADAVTYQTSRTGDATGGTAALTMADGVVTISAIDVSANASIAIESGQNVGSINGVTADNGTGGTASVSITGGTLTVDDASVTAIGRGSGQNPDGSPINPNNVIEQALAGGIGRGGSASFSISGGSATIAQPLLIDASGRGGNGYINGDFFTTQPVASGAGGAGIGGTASLTVSGGLLTAPVVNLRSNGVGGDGGAFWGINAGDAGAGGDGIGGTTNFSASQDIFAINALTLSATGSGGTGGVSADPILDGGFFGYSQGAATGGRGGNGRGGQAILSLDFDPVLASLVIDTSGIGGTGSYGLVGGAGGNGFGGSGAGGARLALNFGDLTVDSLIIRSNGTGGDGGEGSGGPGGIGGNGTGGDAELLADGNGANLTTLDVLVQANGLGGNAGIGRGASDGAAGGNAQGGSASLTISNGATANLGATVIEAIANGGFGSDAPAGLTSGNGGNAIGGNAALVVTGATATASDIFVQSDGSGGDPGVDGTGGNGTGGSASVTVTTGSFSANDAAIRANGRGSTAGGISTGGNAAISSTGGSIDFNTTTASADGGTGAGSGGLVSIIAGADAFGTSGVMALGNTTLTSDSFGGVAGIVRIDNNNGNAAGGVIQFGQLFASADGFDSTNPAGGVYIRADQSDILVTGNANLFARDSIGIDGIGQGTFAANGSIFATAGTDIVITHSGQPGLVDTVRGTIVSLSANRNLDAQTGSIIRGTNFVDAQAVNGFANVDGLFAANNSVVAAGTDATIRNATITGGSLNLSAGRIFANSPTWRRATATIQGAVTVSNALLVNSGGDIVTNNAVIRTGNNAIFNSGDDIIIRNSAISSAQNVTTTGEIQLNAGAITPVDALPGEIRSLVIANSVQTSTGFDLALAADAIDATTATINANRLTALINNAPAPGVVGGNDGGLLAANCVQGNICLGAVSTPTQIQVGPATGTIGLANRVTMAGSLGSNNISIRARDAVAFSGPITVNAANTLLVSVLNGPIDLTGAVSLTGTNALNLYAGAGAITGPSTALLSNGNIGLFASGGINLGSIDAGGVLNTIASDGSITTAGTVVTSGSVTVNAQLAVRGGPASINSGGSITTGSILTTAGNDVLLTSVGAQSLGTVNAGRDLVVNAASLNAATITAQGNVVATVGGGITLGSTTAGNDILLSSGGAQTLGSTTAGRDVIVNAASLNATNIAAQGNVVAMVGGDIALSNTTAGSDVLLTSGGAQSLGTVNAGRDFVVNAASLNATAVAAQGNVVAMVSGDIALGNTTAGSDILLTSGGAQALATTTAGNDILLSSGGAQTLGATSAGRDVIVNAASLNATTIAAQGNVVATVSGNIALGNATAGNDVRLTSVGAQSLGTVNAGRDVLVSAAALNAATINAQGNVVATVSGGITLGNTTAGNDILLTSGGSQALGATSAGRDVTVSAASLNASSVSAQRNFTATVVGGITLGNTMAGNDVLLTSGGAQTLGATSAGRNVIVNGASLTAANVTAQGNVVATVGGGITLGNTSAGNDILLTSGGTQGLGATTAGRDVIVNAAALNAGSIAAQRNVNATVTGNVTVGNTSAALITMRAGQDVSFTGTATATTAIDIGANGQASFNGIASAPNITVRSGNILIGTAGRLGTIGTTQNVMLTNSAGAQMTIGGNGVTGGYSLSDAELSRIFSNNIDLAWTANLANTGAPGTPPSGGFTQPSIVIGAITLSSRASNAAGNLAATGTLSIRTPGTMQVNGAVALNNAGNGNTVRLSADQSLQILAGQGSIAIRDGANALAGTLSLSSNSIIAASASAIADMASQTSPSLIDTRLGMNDGFLSDTGILSANIVNLNAGNTVFVQNTGSGPLFRDRRGITANAINVSLVGPSGTPATNGLIIINGQIATAPTFATGLAAIPLLSINGNPSQVAAGFDTLSTMNGCQITAIAACRQRENPVSVTDDDINQPLDPGQGGDNQFPTALIEVKEFETFGYPPLIDEPVTGSGNDDLWPATCDPDEETCPTAPPPPPAP